MISNKIPGFGYSGSFLKPPGATEAPTRLAPLVKPSVTHMPAPTPAPTPGGFKHPVHRNIDSPTPGRFAPMDPQPEAPLRSTAAVVEMFRRSRKKDDEKPTVPFYHNPYKGLKI